MRFLRYRITYYIFFYDKFNQKIFPKIKFILGNNALEPIGVKSTLFLGRFSYFHKKLFPRIKNYFWE